MKWGRRYRLRVQSIGGNEIIIENPFTIRFSVQKHILSDLNTATLQVYNLSETTRALLYKDFFQQNEYRRVIFEAGYDTFSKVYEGFLFSCTSTRERADIITTFVSKDGGYDIANAVLQQTYIAETPVTQIFNDAVGIMPNLSMGKVGNFPIVLKRPVTIDECAWDAVQKYSNGNCYIENQQVYILNNNETIEGDIQVIDPSTGLLSTPIREEGWFSFKMLFEPRLKLSQYLVIKSSVMKEYNSAYKVIGIQHQGIISEAVNGACHTNIQLQIGDTVLGGSFINV
jgi:hypothetical protein